MPTRTAPRRITAALTAVLVAWALIVLGGASRSTAPTQRLAVGHSHAGSSAPSSQLGSTASKQHVAPHPDLPSTPPTVHGAAPTGSADATASAYASWVVRDLPAPTGRGPPAL